MGFRIFLVLALLLLLAALVAPAFQAARVPARVSPDLKNLRQISIALLSYEATHGFLPPPTVKDPKSGELRSWRVELLPYLDCELLYRQYRVDEPWDSPSNRKLWDQMPDCFAYADRGQDIASYISDYPIGETNYFIVAGDTTLWSSERRRTSTRRKRRPVSSVLLLGAEQTGIKWTEPRDFSIEEARKRLCAPENYPKSFFKDEFFRIRQTNYNRGILTPVGLSDGSTRHLGKLTEDSAAAMLRGQLSWDSLEYGKLPDGSNSFNAINTKSYLKWPSVLGCCLAAVCLLPTLWEFCRLAMRPFRAMANYNSRCVGPIEELKSR